MSDITDAQVEAWVAQYLRAWETGEAADIRRLFTEDAEWHEWPYETHREGLDEIVEGWQSRAAWQEGGWSFTWSPLTINGDTFAIEGIGAYTKLGNFKNLWVVTLADDGRASVFRHWNNEVSG